VTLRDGARSATVRVPLLARPAGSPAGTFFVLLQRASTTVTTASATVLLPAVAAAPAPAAAGGGTATAGASVAASDRADDGPSSALPAADPTAVAEAPAGQDLLLMVAAAVLTGAGVLGVVSVVRGVGMRDARD
jgi:hypothetical protein